MTKKRTKSLLVVLAFAAGWNVLAVLLPSYATAAPPSVLNDLELLLLQVNDLRVEIADLHDDVNMIIDNRVNPNRVVHWRGLNWERRLTLIKNQNDDLVGLQTAQTFVHLFNPQADPVSVTINAYSPQGQLLETYSFNINGHNMQTANQLAFTACGITQLNPGSCSGYLDISATGPVIPSGYVRTGTERTLGIFPNILGEVAKSDARNINWIPVY